MTDSNKTQLRGGGKGRVRDCNPEQGHQTTSPSLRIILKNSCSVDIDECASSPCHSNATCVDELHNYTCICSDGYSGTHCEVNIDECAEDYCNNGSICRDGVNGYSCKCAPGFSGDDCSTEIDECASFPCDYGGTCYDQVPHDMFMK